jgi:hypothetical protein
LVCVCCGQQRTRLRNKFPPRSRHTVSIGRSPLWLHSLGESALFLYRGLLDRHVSLQPLMLVQQLLRVVINRYRNLVQIHVQDVLVTVNNASRLLIETHRGGLVQGIHIVDIVGHSILFAILQFIDPNRVFDNGRRQLHWTRLGQHWRIAQFGRLAPVPQCHLQRLQQERPRGSEWSSNS